MRTRIIGALVVTAFVMTGCGSSSKTTAAGAAATAAPSAVSDAPSSSVAATTAAPSAVVTSAVPSSSAAATTAASASSATAAPACGGLGAAGSGTAVDVKLVEWSITGPERVKAGALTLTITNGGQNTHNVAVVKGSTWDTLPKSANGGLDKAELAPGALIGTTTDLNGGTSCSTTLTLEAGSYVLLCTLGFGGNSHAARGQHVDLAVA